MIYPIMTAALCVICFILCVYCYLLGVKHGRIVRNGGTPHLPNPVHAVEEAVETAKKDKERKETESDLTSVMSYSRESAMKALDAQRTERIKGRG